MHFCKLVRSDLSDSILWSRKQKFGKSVWQLTGFTVTQIPETNPVLTDFILKIECQAEGTGRGRRNRAADPCSNPSSSPWHHRMPTSRWSLSHRPKCFEIIIRRRRGRRRARERTRIFGGEGERAQERGRQLRIGTPCIMAKDYPGSPKVHQVESKRHLLTWILGVSGLCVIFYILGAWQNTPVPKSDPSDVSKLGCTGGASATLPETTSHPKQATSLPKPNLDFEAHHQVDFEDTSPATEKFPPCSMNFSEYTPCQDQNRGRRFSRAMLVYRERHCPANDELVQCLIPAPPGYKTPFKWPQSRDYAWFHNIPHKELSIEKAVQNWIQVDGDRFRFPGGGTMFPRGADAYIDDINELIPLTDGSIRTAIDTGCGVASWGAYLLKRNILAMSFAPRDTHEAQVQFALERGVPAMIGVMASMRIPYPARSFDMAHCSRCLIPWQSLDGLYLIEVDRVLRPGGYWILSGPPIHWKKYYRGWERTQEDLKQEQDSIEEVAKSICWKKVIEKDDLSVWQKPINHNECIRAKKMHKTPHMCKNDNADASWYKKMEACITPLPEVGDEDDVAGGGLQRWPERALAVPPRISRETIPGLTAEKFEKDNELWKERMAHYTKVIPTLSHGRYRNVMDMNANLGGFAAAIDKYKVWVMNVVPVNSDRDTLGIIYERGFIGTYQDWCEAFSTYPRTYDFIHADNVFSIYQDRCDITNILLEMDRILRPEGAVVFRDSVEVLVKIQAITKGMRWESKIMDHESGPFNPEKILLAVKSYWTGEPSDNHRSL